MNSTTAITNITYTRSTKYETSPFGECWCDITFCYYPTKSGENESVEIQSGRIHSNGRWIGLDREEASNLHLHADDHCLEWAQRRYPSELESLQEDAYEPRRAYA